MPLDPDNLQRLYDDALRLATGVTKAGPDPDSMPDFPAQVQKPAPPPPLPPPPPPITGGRRTGHTPPPVRPPSTLLSELWEFVVGVFEVVFGLIILGACGYAVWEVLKYLSTLRF